MIVMRKNNGRSLEKQFNDPWDSISMFGSSEHAKH